ncbi:MAG: DUF2785 domain-containing protein [Pseudomonadota bacterium]
MPIHRRLRSDSRHCLRLALPTLSLLLAPWPSYADFDPVKMAEHASVEDLTQWSADGFPTPSPDQTAQWLATLVGEPDPFLRDDIGFTGLSALLRRDAVTTDTLLALIDAFEARLSGPDPEGVAHSFATLCLAEVVRVDRIKPRFSDKQFERLITIAADTLAGITDYRGYSDDVGWRHAIAHASDLALQIVLNERTDAERLVTLRGALAKHFAPSTPYVHGEPTRLARPILYMAIRADMERTGWADWLDATVDQTLAQDRTDGGLSRRLARRHNLRAVIVELYAKARGSDRPDLADLAVASFEALQTIDRHPL